MFMLQYIFYICNLEFRRPSHSNIYSINCMYIRQILHENQLFHEKFKPKLSFECFHLNYVMVQHDNHCVKKPQASKKKKISFLFLLFKCQQFASPLQGRVKFTFILKMQHKFQRVQALFMLYHHSSMQTVFQFSCITTKRSSLSI